MRNACEICGHRIEFIHYWMAWVGSMTKGQPNHRAPRWPRRRNLCFRCPECRHLVMVAQEISGRGYPVTEFLSGPVGKVSK